MQFWKPEHVSGFLSLWLYRNLANVYFRNLPSKDRTRARLASTHGGFLPTLLWAGLMFTIPLTILSFIFGLSLGLLTALVRLFAPVWVSLIARFYVWIFRGTPMLVQLFVIFYGLPSAGIYLDAFTAAVIGFSLNVGAYSSEVIRAVISSVPKGQWEAAYSIGMSWRQALTRTILPQATRTAVPPLSNTFISLVKTPRLPQQLRCQSFSSPHSASLRPPMNL